MNLIERWLARRDPRRRQPHESRALWQTRRLAERSDEHHPQLRPPVFPEMAHPIDDGRNMAVPIIATRIRHG